MWFFRKRFKAANEQPRNEPFTAAVFNPYVDIDVCRPGDFLPQSCYPGFFPQYEEHLMFAVPAAVFTENNTVVGSLTTPSGASRYIRDTVKVFSDGDLLITDQRVMFVGPADGFEISIDSISILKQTYTDAFSFLSNGVPVNIKIDNKMQLVFACSVIAQVLKDRALAISQKPTMTLTVSSDSRALHKDANPSYNEYKAERTRRAQADSLAMQKVHQNEIDKIDIDTLKRIRPNRAIMLEPYEVQFMRKINKQSTSAPYIAGYWTYEYKLDYQTVLERLIAGGYLELSSVEYTLSKYLVADLKAILKTFVPHPEFNSKKQELVDQILDVVPDDVLEDNFYARYYVITKKGFDALEGATGELPHYEMKQYKKIEQ